MPTSRVAEYDDLNAPITFLAELLNDIEDLRKATGNRLWQLEHGDLVGTGMEGVAQQMLDDLAATEIGVVKELQRAMKRHPLGPWVQSAPGVGLKQGARLLAAIGNPYWNARDGRPRRGPAELWAYCGYHVLPASQKPGDIHGAPAGGHPLADTDLHLFDAQSRYVGVGQPSRPDQSPVEAQDAVVGANPLPSSQLPPDAQRGSAGGHFLVSSDQGASGIHPPGVAADHPLHPDDQFPHAPHVWTVVGVAPRRTKGQRANWSAQARSRAWLIASSCVKQPKGTRYRDVYDTGRAKYADAVHAVICQRCSACATCGGPLDATKKDHLAERGCDKRKAAYAGPGSPLTPAHQHARALRLIAKEVLKDIFVEARAWHETEES